MALLYKKIGVTAHSNLKDRDKAIMHVVSILKDSGAQIFLDKKRCVIAQLKGTPCYTKISDLDLLVVIGGDGTIFRAIREMDDTCVPILSVDRGRVGFLAEVPYDEAKKEIPRLLSGRGHLEERSMLFVTAMRGKTTLAKAHVLNEAVISQGAISRLMDLHALIDGEPLTVFRADGVIIATPTGSTAYSLAAGGPIVHPRMSSTILTPINPHSFSQRPLIVPSDLEIAIEVRTKENKYRDLEVSLTFDGQTYIALRRGDIVRALSDGKTVKFLRRKKDTFFETLRSKLKWGDSL